jgi:plastocyanin
MIPTQATPQLIVAGALFAALSVGPPPGPRAPAPAIAVGAKLSEWKVELSTATVAAGTVTFTVANVGSIPHAFEVEGQGIEKQTAVIQPGTSAALTLSLKPGTYDVYCPVGDDSHKKLGMDTRLTVVGANGAGSSSNGDAGMGRSHMAGMSQAPATGPAVQAIQVTSGGPVIQILPGPFPFPDSAAEVIKQFGPEQAGLEAQIKNGPYSDNVARITGTFKFTAWDKGATRDSVDGVAEFTTQDGARWKVVMDRVQTQDVPHHPRFGGVILGLYYHGNTGVHTPLVPTIRSDVALWAVAHLYRNDTLVTDNAQVHAMLLSRTRRDGDFALECWDCSKNLIDELQLQITPAAGEAKFDAPGGFLFVNWEKSSGTNPTAPQAEE